MRLLFFMDDWIIYRLERFTHWTQRQFGITATHWERLFLMFSLFWIFAIDFPRFHHIALRVLLFVFSLSILLHFWLTYHKVVKRTEEAVMNPRKLRGQTTRIIFLVISPVLILGSIGGGTAAPLAANLAEYFGCLDEPPPGECKLRSLFRKLTSFQILTPARTTR